MATLGVIVGSVREGRVGLPVAEWFMGHVRAHGAFEPVLLDLKAIDLPMLTASKHPRLGGYELPATQAWAAQVKACDAFAFVMADLIKPSAGCEATIVRSKAFGFSIAIYPSAGMGPVCAALDAAYKYLLEHGSTDGSPVPAYDMKQLHEIEKAHGDLFNILLQSFLVLFKFCTHCLK